MTDSRGQHAGREAGFLLLPVIFLIVIIAGLSAAFLTRGLGEKMSVTHHETSMLALEIAEMGLLKAEMELSGDVDADADGLGNVSGSYGGGTYAVHAVQDQAEPRYWILTATGTHGHSRRRVEVGVRVRQENLFRFAVFGRDHVTFQSDSSTDSFDSELGTYVSQLVGVDANGPHAGTDAPAGSNGGITLQGGAAVVRGDATPGPTSTVSISAPAWVVGSTDPADEPAAVSDPPLQDFEAAFASNENAILDVTHPMITYDEPTMSVEVKDGAELVLPEGTYFFHDLSLSGGGILRTTGACTIYLTGNMDLSGGVLVNGSGTAKDLLVFAHPYDLPAESEGGLPAPDVPAIRTSGSGTCVMAVYAPAYDVKVYGTSEFYGAIVGRDVDLHGGSKVHYDQALARIDEETPTTERLYWVDRQVPRF